MRPFDATAKAYDEEFTYTATGSLQRQRVYHHLKPLLQQKKISTILELNCGTGEDALWLARQGYEVLATDISSEMIGILNQKIKQEGLTKIKTAILAIEDLENLKGQYSFDLIFSNFGGFNCISPSQWQKMGAIFSDLLTTKGVLIAVIMSKNCWWEKFYFTLKRQFNTAKRRQQNTAVAARLDAHTFVDTWYYNPKEFYNFMAAEFDYQAAQPIGWLLPPSYLDPWFRNKKGLLNLFYKIEKRIPQGDFWAATADHFLLQLQKSS